MELAEVTKALYGLPRAEFIAARDERVKSARTAGDRELAAAIGRLRRPTAAAWLVNRLAREQPASLAGLAELGAALRAAHHDLDGAALRELSTRRQTLINELLAASRDLGRDAGHPVSDAVARELEEIFTAALATANEARAVASGHLSSAKGVTEASALSWPETDPATRPQPAPSPPTRPQPAPSPPTRPRPSPPDPTITRARAELDRLTTALHQTETAAADAQHVLNVAAEAETGAHARVAALRAELTVAERHEHRSRDLARKARREREDAERVLRDTRRRREVAVQRFTALTGELS
ncbi:MAG: hypothetical protein M3Z25_05870 [Actinomycetota bacterium]|nr:hypothetical protein [Actinomycetota bacterium]